MWGPVTTLEDGLLPRYFSSMHVISPQSTVCTSIQTSQLRRIHVYSIHFNGQADKDAYISVTYELQEEKKMQKIQDRFFSSFFFSFQILQRGTTTGCVVTLLLCSCRLRVDVLFLCSSIFLIVILAFSVYQS